MLYNTNIPLFQILYHRGDSTFFAIFERYYFPIMRFRTKLISAFAAFVAMVSVTGGGICHAQTKRVVVGSEVTHGLITEKALERQVAFLADSICNGRGTGTTGNTEAAMWIMREFNRLGIVPMGESYSHSFRASNGTVARNVVGMLPSISKTSSAYKKYMIVTAHYDGYGELEGNMYPGADSNASGVVAMLGAGKMVGAMMSYGKTYRQNIIFVALDAKNINMDGVKAFWDELATGKIVDPVNGKVITKEDISIMVNIDQIGSTLSPLKSGDSNYLIFLADKDAEFHRGSLRYANSRYSLGLDLGFDYYGSTSFTDMFYRRVSEQKIFLDNKVPAVMFTSGITMNNNKTRDTADTLDYTVLMKRIWAIFHWIERTM